MFQNKREDEPDFRTPKGFRKVYEEYGRYVYSTCYQYIRDESECDDLTSKIFLSLWERKDSLKIKGSLKHYLYRAAKLQVFDYFKLEQRRANRLQKAVQELSLFDTVVENEVWYRDLTQQLNKSVEGLPPQRREVFRLIKVEGLSIKEAAKQMSISENTVKTHLSKALSQLKERLSDFTGTMRSTGS